MYVFDKLLYIPLSISVDTVYVTKINKSTPIKIIQRKMLQHKGQAQSAEILKNAEMLKRGCQK